MTEYYCKLCDNFIADSSTSHGDRNSEIFHHFFDMHQTETATRLRAEDIFSSLLRSGGWTLGEQQTKELFEQLKPENTKDIESSKSVNT
ncbi:MAG: hypothetical protein WBX01_12705 [Nitrososphaeraceae archaeon]